VNSKNRRQVEPRPNFLDSPLIPVVMVIDDSNRSARRVLDRVRLAAMTHQTPVSEKPPVPSCPRCSSRMMLARLTPRLGGMPKLESYRCAACGEVQTIQREESAAASVSGK
jgi:transposase-like protein